VSLAGRGLSAASYRPFVATTRSPVDRTDRSDAAIWGDASAHPGMLALPPEMDSPCSGPTNLGAGLRPCHSGATSCRGEPLWRRDLSLCASQPLLCDDGSEGVSQATAVDRDGHTRAEHQISDRYRKPPLVQVSWR